MKTIQSVIVFILIATIGLGAISVPFTHQETICAIVLEDHVRSRSFPALNTGPSFGTYFINGVSSFESNALWTAFKTNWPRVVIGNNRLYKPEGSGYLDRQTGLNASVFEAKVISYEFPKAKARSISSYASLGAEALLYTLLYTNGQWTIINKRNDGFALQNQRPVYNLVAKLYGDN